MTIGTLDGIGNALGNNNSEFVINKASASAQTTGQPCSMWRMAGEPGAGAIPGTTPTVPTKATLGAIPFNNQTSPATSYLATAEVISSNSGGGVQFHDRVAHMGGLSFNVTTSQAITGLDLSTIGLAVDRRGPSNYGALQWFLEVYTDSGATASNATINVTYNDGTTGNLNVIAVGGTLRASRLLPLTSLIPSADQGKYIRGINSVILSAATGTVGNFGFTCTRRREGKAFGNAGTPAVVTWADGLANIPNDSCLMLVVSCSTTTSGTLSGGGQIAHG